MRSSRASRASCRAQVADTDVTDATSFNLCAEINQASLDWALDAAGADARARYDAIGEKLVRSSVVLLFTVARETRDLPPPSPPTNFIACASDTLSRVSDLDRCNLYRTIMIVKMMSNTPHLDPPYPAAVRASSARGARRSGYRRRPRGADRRDGPDVDRQAHEVRARRRR
jgi:hypothetical protein